MKTRLNKSLLALISSLIFASQSSAFFERWGLAFDYNNQPLAEGTTLQLQDRNGNSFPNERSTFQVLNGYYDLETFYGSPGDSVRIAILDGQYQGWSTSLSLDSCNQWIIYSDTQTEDTLWTCFPGDIVNVPLPKKPSWGDIKTLFR